MTVREIKEVMEKDLGWNEDMVKDHHLYLSIIALAAHFYTLGFSQSVSEFLDADEDYVSSITR